MKKFIPAILALVMILSLVGCGSGSDVVMLEEGKLLVGSEIGYPPFEMFDEDGTTIIGLDAELGTAIGDILGMEVEFIDTGFDGILGGLKAKKYDIVMSAVTITADRAKEVDFSNPYIENWQAIAVKKDGQAITSIKDLEGKKLAYQEGTTSKEYISVFIDKGELTCEQSEFPKILNCFDDLRLDRVDAVLCDSVVAERYVADEPDTFVISWNQKDEQGEEPELFGIAVRKGNTELLDKINDALQQLEDNGTLDSLRAKWLSAGDED